MQNQVIGEPKANSLERNVSALVVARDAFEYSRAKVCRGSGQPDVQHVDQVVVGDAAGMNLCIIVVR